MRKVNWDVLCVTILVVTQCGGASLVSIIIAHHLSIYLSLHILQQLGNQCSI